MITKRFQIGDYVIVHRAMFRSSPGNRKVWISTLPFTIPPLGQIIGITTRYDGFVEYQCLGEDGGFHCFSPTKAHCFWLVRFGLSNKEVCVADEDVYAASVEQIHRLPYSYPPQRKSNREKQFLSEDSKHWPRDAKGRWTKGPCIH